MENTAIADRLDAFAALLELSEANPYTIRAYRRASELIRGTAAPVEKLVRQGRIKELRGIGSGIEARLKELLETGQIAELAELEREVQPDLVGLGRYLGIGARQAVLMATSQADFMTAFVGEEKNWNLCPSYYPQFQSNSLRLRQRSKQWPRFLICPDLMRRRRSTPQH